MTLTLDPQLEQRIQRKIDHGHFREPAEVIARALELLESEEEWLRRKPGIDPFDFSVYAKSPMRVSSTWRSLVEATQWGLMATPTGAETLLLA